MLTADAVIVGLIVFFAAWGAVTGAARQLGQLGGVAVAYFAVRFLTPSFAPAITSAMGVSPGIGRLVAAALLFMGTVFVVRMALTRGLEQLLVGKDAKTRAPDRWLGFLLGGIKAGAACYVMLSAIVYAQEAFSLGSRRLEVVSRRSWSYQWVKSHNPFGLTPGALRDIKKKVDPLPR